MPTGANSQIIVVSNRAALAQDAAQHVIHRAANAVAARGHASIALAGGSTPRNLYALLAQPATAAQIDWTRVHLFWGDERAVPPDDAASNYRMTYEALVAHVPIPPENVHRIPAEKPAAEAAREYEQTLRAYYAPVPAHLGEPLPEWPCFDLVLLGLGANGHTASLFPHTALLHDRTHWVAAEYIAEVQMNRITLTVPAINAARTVLFMVAGADKAATVREVIAGEPRPEELPAQLIQPTAGELIWLLDRDAAGSLPAGRTETV